MSKPAAFIVVKNGQTWLRTSAETEEAIRTGLIMETVPLYTAPPKRELLSDKEITKNTPKLIHIGERLAFHAGVRFAEKHHGIGEEDEHY